MLKCHVFRCDVPAKAIASALHGLCAQILSERVGVSGDSVCCSPDPISPEDLPRQAELLDAVSQAAQKYEALYMGTLPVTKAMGMDVLNEAIGTLTARGDKNAWVPAVLSVSDSLMTAHSIQAEASAEEEPLWQCPVRLVTFIGVGHDPHTFGLIADLGRQSFQCAAFWCQPHAGGLSEAVQAACMGPEESLAGDFESLRELAQGPCGSRGLKRTVQTSPPSSQRRLAHIPTSPRDQRSRK
uniref:Amyloid beta protein binding family B member 3 n=1 Tax=Marmota marmota marmota TaxID=9994 RepID=A0A8C5ZEZ5_MARMA